MEATIPPILSTPVVFPSDVLLLITKYEWFE